MANITIHASASTAMANAGLNSSVMTNQIVNQAPSTISMPLVWIPPKAPLTFTTEIISVPTAQEVVVTATPSASTAQGTPITIVNTRGQRPGKIPYEQFPPCYVQCFESEGQKTWGPGVSDIRDMTVDEFCRSENIYVINWFAEHLQFCVAGTCSSSTQSHHEAKIVYDKICA